MPMRSSCVQHWHIDYIPFKAVTTTGRFQSITNWFLAANAAEVEATIRAMLTGEAQVALAARYATVRPDEADTSFSLLSTYVTSTSEVARKATLSANTAMWAQLGFATGLETGDTEGAGQAGADIWHHQCAEMLGTATFGVPPALTDASGGNNNLALVVAVGPPAPTLSLNYLKGGIIVKGNVSGELQTMLVYRTGVNPAKMGAWQFNLEAGWDTPPTNPSYDERNTGELAPTIPSGDTLIQAGVAVRRNGNATQVRADIEAAVMAIR